MAEIGVGLVGYKFMGRAHSNAYRQLPRFFDVDPAPRMAAICGRDEAGVREAAGSLGWESYETDYRRLIERDDVGLVDVVTPGNTHREIVLAAFEAGKARDLREAARQHLAEAKEMLDAAREAGTVNTVCFNYRRAPAVQLAKKLVDEGRLGDHPALARDVPAGLHNGPRVSPDLAPQEGARRLGRPRRHRRPQRRPRPVPPGRHLRGRRDDGDVRQGAPPGRVGRGDGRGRRWTTPRRSSRASRTGPSARSRPRGSRRAGRNQNAFEINGSKGSVAFDLERMNELEVFFVDDDADVQGFRTVNVTEPDHPYAGAWWPPGHILGYEHTFVHTMKDLMDGIKTGKSPAPTFEDAYRVQAVLDAVERSAEDGGWTRPEDGGI